MPCAEEVTAGDVRWLLTEFRVQPNPAGFPGRAAGDWVLLAAAQLLYAAAWYPPA